ncbi:erythromycin esterase [Clostridium punense]|uniref:Erythromycin esterase n=2 Tax=Clostridium TaxID=1485 RepID=A0ABS4K7E9_9CLOT|nr:erythromycin esterase family protein [Clostridium punense]MBP2023713.1 erythromycin esterase [Clostridium punense]
MGKFKKTIIFTLIIIVVILGTCGFYYVKRNLVTKALKKELIPLKTVEASSSFEDMEPLKEVLKDKQIVAMGEATHGTSEFFKMKHRMLEFLVEEMGYRVFAIEGDFGAAEIINDYVLKGEGTAKEALGAMEMWQWDTTEVLNMIEWMRKYNEDPSHERKVKFYGFDMQSKEHSVRSLFKYLEKTDETVSKEYRQKFERYINNSIRVLKREDYDSVLTHTPELMGVLEKNKESFVSKTSAEEYNRAVQHLKIINKNAKYFKARIVDVYGVDSESNNLRDEAMAENVKWIIDYESKLGNEKIMLWGHNFHITKLSPDFTAMGEQLSKLYGDKYYSVAFDFHEGSFNAIQSDSRGFYTGGVMKFTIKPMKIKMLSDSFVDTGIYLGFLDFKKASEEEEIKELIMKQQRIHFVANGYVDNEEWLYKRITPTKSFDGLIFIKDTTEVTKIIR